MLKFRCQHCGQRIAVGARHLGKLVTCPECGKPTHPLAEQIVSLQAAPADAASAPAPARAAKAPPAEPEERCANCGDAVGRLQKRNLWQEHLVCAPCHARLSGEADAEAAARVAAEARAALPRAASESAADGAPQRASTRREPEPWWPAPADPALPAAAPLLARGAAAGARMALAGVVAVAALIRRPRPAGPGASSDGDPTFEPIDYAAGDDLPAVIEGQDLPARTDDPAAGLRTVPLPLHTRLLIILAVICLAGAAVYGTLTLLRDLAGYLTAAALVLLAAGGGYLVLRLSLSAGRRFFPVRAGGRPGNAGRGSAE